MNAAAERTCWRCGKTPLDTDGPTCPEPTVVILTVKVCKRCGQPKPLDDFGRHNRTADGRRVMCRDCFRPNYCAETLEETVARFWSRVEKSDGCWLWTGATSDSGYGHLSVNGQQIYAHRFSYELHFGPLAPGFFGCHRCDVFWPDLTYRRCVRPNHLFAGTHLDNMRDAKAKGRTSHKPLPEASQPRGEAHGMAKLTEEAVREVRRRHAEGGISFGGLAREFGVSPDAIAFVIRRKTWAHIL